MATRFDGFAEEMGMAGFTYDKARIGKILGEIERRKKAAKDFVGDTRKVRAIAADGTFTVGFNQENPSAVLDASSELYGFNKNGQNQFADSLGIPRAFFDRMKAGAHLPELAHLSNHLLETEPETKMFRTLDGDVRAVLSTSYRTLDNADLFFLAADEFQKVGAEIWEARLSDDSFRLYAVQPGIQAEIRDEVKNGSHWTPEDGGNAGVDRHVAAVALQNSETGRGSLQARPCTLRMICANWNVWDQSLTKIHLGKKRGEEGWISTHTQRLEDNVVWSKIRDIIKTAFNPAKFNEIIAKLQGAKNDKTADPIQAVQATVEFCGLPETSLDSIRNKFVMDKDYSRYGLMQAVTFQAHGAATDEERDAWDDAGAKVLASPLKTILR